jgi:HNH endonuclease
MITDAGGIGISCADRPVERVDQIVVQLAGPHSRLFALTQSGMAGAAPRSRARSHVRPRGHGDSRRLLDHIVPIRTAPERRLDPANLRSLCWSRHIAKTQRQHREKS